MDMRQDSMESSCTVRTRSSSDLETIENALGTVDLSDITLQHHNILEDGAAGSTWSSAKQLGSYMVLHTIGKGTFAVVKLGYHMILKTRVAIKIMDRNLIGEKNMVKVYREIEAMKKLRHPHIIALYEVIEKDSQVCLVMEYAPRGELFDHIIKVKHLNESEAREIFWQSLCAVSCCHFMGIAHRDLKAENLLLDKDNKVKITDFGFCNFMIKGVLLDTHCGSPQYASPELFKGEVYDGTKVDIWSLGVILYILVCGSFPFSGDCLGAIKQSVLRGLVRFPFYLSHECESLIRSMLQPDPSKRPTLRQISGSPWLHRSENTETYLKLIAQYELVARGVVPTTAVSSEIIQILEYMGYSAQAVADAVSQNLCNELSAAYFIILDKIARKGLLRPLPETAEHDHRDNLPVQMEEDDECDVSDEIECEFRHSHSSFRRHTLAYQPEAANFLNSRDYFDDPSLLSRLPQLNLTANLTQKVLNQPISTFTIKDPNLLCPPEVLLATAPLSFPRRASDGAARSSHHGFDAGPVRGNSCPEDNTPGSPNLTGYSSNQEDATPLRVRSSSSSPKTATSRHRLSTSAAGGPIRRYGSYKERKSVWTGLDSRGNRRRSEGATALAYSISRGSSTALNLTDLARRTSQATSEPGGYRKRQPPSVNLDSEDDERDLLAIENLNAKLRMGVLQAPSPTLGSFLPPSSPQISVTDERGQVISLVGAQSFDFPGHMDWSEG